MTWLDKLAQAVAAMTKGPWYIDLTTTSPDFIGSKSHVRIYSHDHSGTHHHPDVTAVVALRNCAEELIAVAVQLRRFREDWNVTPTPAMEALAALEKKLEET